MASLHRETVIDVHHWSDQLFSFKTTRQAGFRFRNGHFTMIGLEQEDKRPLLRAYSMASANYDDYLEFFSIKVPNGPLTSQLQGIKPGDEILVNSKSTGTLVCDHLHTGGVLFLLATGTGLAPFLSVIKDPEVYEQFDKVVLVHGVRWQKDLAYRDFIEQELPNNEFFGDLVRQKLQYYPTVTREDGPHRGRITQLLESGQLFRDLGLDQAQVDRDRFMLCGSPGMIKDTCTILDGLGFKEVRHGDAGHYVVERAFVES